MTLLIVTIDEVKPEDPRRYYPADRIDELELTAIDSADDLEGPMHLNPFAGSPEGWVAIVDRPAPPTVVQPPPVLDLDALAEAERAMTAGPWFVESAPRFGGAISVMVDGLPRQVAEANGQALVVDKNPAARQIANAAGIVALRNAAPHLIAEARAAVALRAEVADLAAIRADERARYLRDGARHLAERDHALAALAEAKRLGLEACEAAREAESRADHERDGRLTSPRTSAAIRAALEAL